MKITVIGGGPVGLTYCALLQQGGHSVGLWSQTHPNGLSQRFDGAFSGDHAISGAGSLEDAVRGADVIVLARCAQGMQDVLDRLAPILDGQAVIFSAELSFGSIYLAHALERSKTRAGIVSWSTTVATAQRKDGAIRVGTVRDVIDMAVSGAMPAEDGLRLCQALFGDRFRLKESPALIGMSNLNPPIHLANSLANLTRIEQGEDWENYQCITPVVGRMIEALDTERLALAGRFGFEVRDVFDHYMMTFPGIRRGSVSEMARQVYERAPGTMGPRSLETRYITEDVPFGLIPLCELGRRCGVPMPLHEAAIATLSAYLGRDFRAQNGMLETVVAELQDRLQASTARTGG